MHCKENKIQRTLLITFHQMITTYTSGSFLIYPTTEEENCPNVTIRTFNRYFLKQIEQSKI